jgi:hypothetical protein
MFITNKNFPPIIELIIYLLLIIFLIILLNIKKALSQKLKNYLKLTIKQYKIINPQLIIKAISPVHIVL